MAISRTQNISSSSNRQQTFVRWCLGLEIFVILLHPHLRCRRCGPLRWRGNLHQTIQVPPPVFVPLAKGLWFLLLCFRPQTPTGRAWWQKPKGPSREDSPVRKRKIIGRTGKQQKPKYKSERDQTVWKPRSLASSSTCLRGYVIIASLKEILLLKCCCSLIS